MHPFRRRLQLFGPSRSLHPLRLHQLRINGAVQERPVDGTIAFRVDSTCVRLAQPAVYTARIPAERPAQQFAAMVSKLVAMRRSRGDIHVIAWSQQVGL